MRCRLRSVKMPCKDKDRCMLKVSKPTSHKVVDGYTTDAQQAKPDKVPREEQSIRKKS